MDALMRDGLDPQRYLDETERVLAALPGSPMPLRAELRDSLASTLAEERKLVAGLGATADPTPAGWGSQAGLGLAALRMYAQARLAGDDERCRVLARLVHAAAVGHQAMTALAVLDAAEVGTPRAASCRCGCPACSFGTCACLRNGIDLGLRPWGTAPFGSLLKDVEAAPTVSSWMEAARIPDGPTGRGATLLLQPRAGTPLAAAARAGDRILAVGGRDVRTNPELLQAAAAVADTDCEVRLERDGKPVTAMAVAAK